MARKDVLFVPYGSYCYGTVTDYSDKDFLAIVDNIKDVIEFNENKLNIHAYPSAFFQSELSNHKINCMEAYFYDCRLSTYSFKLDLLKLRSEISSKASNSFVKAKKKITVEKDFYIGWKSLFHSLRILNFGTQIATHGRIVDFTDMSEYWYEIFALKSKDWDFLKAKYQPIYNKLATEFKKVAPKE